MSEERRCRSRISKSFRVFVDEVLTINERVYVERLWGAPLVSSLRRDALPDGAGSSTMALALFVLQGGQIVDSGLSFTMGARNSLMTLEGLMSWMMDCIRRVGMLSKDDLVLEVQRLVKLEKKDPRQRFERRRKRRAKQEVGSARANDVDAPESPTAVPAESDRYVPTGLRDEVLHRAHYRCEFVSHHGTQCEERTRLEIDHIEPFAKGGATTADNLRCLCRAHNQRHAERSYGIAFMQEKIMASQHDRNRLGASRWRGVAGNQRAAREAGHGSRRPAHTAHRPTRLRKHRALPLPNAPNRLGPTPIRPSDVRSRPGVQQLPRAKAHPYVRVGGEQETPPSPNPLVFEPRHEAPCKWTFECASAGDALAWRVVQPGGSWGKNMNA